MTGTEMNSVIDHLSAKLAIPAQELMKRLPTIGYKDFAVFVISGMAFLISLIVCITGIALSDREGKCGNAACVMALLGGAFTALTGAIVLINLPSALLWIHSPDAWALSYLLKMLK